MQQTIDYEDFELQIGPRTAAGWHVRVRSPAGEGESVVPEIAVPRLRHAAPSGGAAECPPADVGRRLFHAVFIGQVRDLFHQSLSRVRDEAPRRGLRIRLRMDPHDLEAFALSDLPWELLQRDGTQDFLALSRSTPVVRDIPLPRPARWTPLTPPLRVLVVAAQTLGLGELDLATELAKLGASVRRSPGFEIEVLEDPDTQSLRDAFGRTPFDVLHFMGHGAFDPGSGKGSLLLAGRSGSGATVSGQHLAIKLNDFPSLRLVVLNACETARSASASGEAPFGGVATALLLGGVPAVVAMQQPICDADAIAFSGAFYEHLAAGRPLEQAVTEGRQAIHSAAAGGVDWAIPVLFMRAASGELFARADGRRRRRTKQALAGLGALVVTLSVVAGLTTLADKRSDGSSGSDSSKEGVEETKTTEESSSDKLELEPEPTRDTSTRRTAPQPPPAPARSTTVEAGGLRFEVVAGPEIRATVAEALRRGASKINAGSVSSTRLEVASPRVNETTVAGPPGFTCRLSASCSALRQGASVDLGTVRTDGFAFDEAIACETAADKLVAAVLARLARSQLEG